MRTACRAGESLAHTVAEAAAQVKTDQLTVFGTDLIANAGIRHPIGHGFGVAHFEIFIDRHPQP